MLRRIALCAVAGWAAFTLGPAGASACPIQAGNLGELNVSFGAPPTGPPVAAPVAVAGGFTTGPVATQLSAVTVALTSVASTNGYVDLDLWADDGTGTAPGEFVVTVRRHLVVAPWSPETPVVQLVAIPQSGVTLAPNSTYWVVLKIASDAPVGTPATVWKTVVPASAPTTGIVAGHCTGTSGPWACTTSVPVPVSSLLFEVRACPSP